MKKSSALRSKTSSTSTSRARSTAMRAAWWSYVLINTSSMCCRWMRIKRSQDFWQNLGIALKLVESSRRVRRLDSGTAKTLEAFRYRIIQRGYPFPLSGVLVGGRALFVFDWADVADGA